MNMLWLHDDPEIAAQLHCDKHVTEMCVEYAQILSTAADMGGFFVGERMYEPIPDLNPKVHDWAAESSDNYIRLLKMAKALGDEYSYRYGGEYKSTKDVVSRIDITDVHLPERGETEPPLCMPDEYKVDGDVVESYRKFYNHGKKWDMSWFKRDVPEWYHTGARILHE